MTLVPYVEIETSRAANCFVLTPGSSKEEVALVETALGRELPSVARNALDNWNERGARVLLDDAPRIVNPDARNEELEPTLLNTSLLFPTFTRC